MIYIVSVKFSKKVRKEPFYGVETAQLEIILATTPLFFVFQKFHRLPFLFISFIPHSKVWEFSGILRIKSCNCNFISIKMKKPDPLRVLICDEIFNMINFTIAITIFFINSIS